LVVSIVSQEFLGVFDVFDPLIPVLPDKPVLPDHHG
jgi:hypothetical protein